MAERTVVGCKFHIGDKPRSVLIWNVGVVSPADGI